MTATNNVNASRWLVWAGVVTRRFAAPSRYRRGLRLEQLRRRTSVVTRRMAWTPTIAVNVSLSRADTWVTERGEREALTLGSPWHARPDTDGPVRTSPTVPSSSPRSMHSSRTTRSIVGPRTSTTRTPSGSLRRTCWRRFRPTASTVRAKSCSGCSTSCIAARSCTSSTTRA